MMMIHQQQHQQLHPTVEIPQWDPPYEDPFSPQTTAYFTALQRYLPSQSQSQQSEFDSVDSDESDEFDSFSCDEFRMYEFKVRRCARGRSHDWTECPFAHPGEKARRRDPRKFHYSGVACPEFRRGCCRKGDVCEFAHGVFECWLHPARYRTQPCKDGPHCKRRVCFFAHSPDQLRVVVPNSPESPPSRLGVDSDSPPMSPPSYSGSHSVGDILGKMQALRVGGLSMSPPSRLSESDLSSPSYMQGLRLSMSPRSPWDGVQMCGGFGSPRTPTSLAGMTRYGLGRVDEEEEVPMQRVESGKGIRAKMYAKLSQENSLGCDQVETVNPGPDFGWVSELVK